jgi:hypothetical protein
MNKLVALLLIVAMPALAQQQTSLVPSFEQAEAKEPAVSVATEARPLYARPETWAIAGLGTVTVVAIIVAVVVASAKASAPVKQADFACNGAAAPRCDGWINPPAQ